MTQRYQLAAFFLSYHGSLYVYFAIGKLG